MVVEVEGEAIDSGDELRRAVAEREPGDELELTVRGSDGETRDVTVTLGTRPGS